MIAFYKARLHDKSKPIGSFLFVGPTGVGKTELARTLAEFFFGSERRMLRFDMSEFADYNSFEMLIGSPQASPERPARLVDPVRLQPFQVLLFDELEKAHRNIQDLFLQLLDEGRLTTPRGETVELPQHDHDRHLERRIVRGHDAVDRLWRQGDGYDADKAMRRSRRNFRPEFLNRFQHVVLFHPLTRDQATRIARIDLQSVLRREGIAGRNLIVDVHDDVIEHVLGDRIRSALWRPRIKREIKRQIILPLATLLMERAPEPGSLIDAAHGGRTRAHPGRRYAGQPCTPRPSERRSGPDRRSPDAREHQRIELRARTACETLVADSRPRICSRAEIEKIDAERKGHVFWHDRR